MKAAQRVARMTEPMKELEKLMRLNAYGHSLHEVFRDFCEMSAIAISNSVDLVKREEREARYMALVARYKPEEMARFPQMLGCLVLALEEEFQDALGKLFMALELGNHWVGQFFTPYEVALTMAKMQLVDADELVKGKGFITVCDPTCGAGCTLIAVAHAMKDAGINYQQAMHATAQDLDATAAHMCYIQLALLHVPAVVVVGDSLRMEEHDRWYTPAHYLGFWDAKLARARERDPAPVTDSVPTEAKVVSATAQPPVTIQLSLFGGEDQ